MHNSVGQSGQTAQAVRLIEIGDDRYNTGGSEFGHPGRLAGDGKNAEALAQQWQQPHADIAATDQQQARQTKLFDRIFFH